MPTRMKIAYTDTFLIDASSIDAERIQRHLETAIRNLQAFPDMGNPKPRASLRRRYGEDIRTLPVCGHLLVYRHGEERLELIAFPWGALVT